MEFVFVVERTELFDLAHPQGFRSAVDHHAELEKILERSRRQGFFMERRKAETDSRFKQIIPYVVIRRGNEVLLLERQAKQGEQRLHGKLSIGIGGHINPVDEAEGDVLVTGLRRELEEELHVQGPLRLHLAGCLNDDHSAVGSVHFGLVAVADAAEADVSIRETDMMAGEFVSVATLRQRHQQDASRFETWSAFLIDSLDEVLAADLPLEKGLQARG